MEISCNGWTNYETWRVYLEIFDGDAVDADTIEQYEDDESGLVAYLKEMADDALTQYGEIKEPSLAIDYARAFVSEVNFYEIAEHMIADWRANKEYEEKEEAKKSKV